MKIDLYLEAVRASDLISASGNNDGFVDSFFRRRCFVSKMMGRQGQMISIWRAGAPVTPVNHENIPPLKPHCIRGDETPWLLLALGDFASNATQLPLVRVVQDGQNLLHVGAVSQADMTRSPS